MSVDGVAGGVIPPAETNTCSVWHSKVNLPAEVFSTLFTWPSPTLRDAREGGWETPLKT